MSEISIKEKLHFGDVDLVAPENVVEEKVKQIEEATDGIVKCITKPYDGPIESYTVPGLGGLAIITQDTKHDIQKDLGPLGYTITKYEVYYTASNLPHYRFRILFFEYGIGGYPVKIVLEQSIAKAINRDLYIYNVKNRTDLETLLDRILSSSKSIEIIQDLINATVIAASRKADEDIDNSSDVESNDDNGE